MQMTTVRDSTGSSGAQCRTTHRSPRGKGIYTSPQCVQEFVICPAGRAGIFPKLPVPWSQTTLVQESCFFGAGP